MKNSPARLGHAPALATSIALSAFFALFVVNLPAQVPNFRFAPLDLAVMTDTNGVLVAPTNFFAANSNRLIAVVAAGGGGLSTNLAPGNIYIGNALSNAVPRLVSGAVTNDTNGVFYLTTNYQTHAANLDDWSLLGTNKVVTTNFTGPIFLSNTASIFAGNGSNLTHLQAGNLDNLGTLNSTASILTMTNLQAGPGIAITKTNNAIYVATNGLVAAGAAGAIKGVTGNYTITTNDFSLYVNSTNTVVLTLPAAAGLTNLWRVVNLGTGQVIVTNGNGTDTIGMSNYLSYTNFALNQAVGIQGNGTNAFVLFGGIYAQGSGAYLQIPDQTSKWLGSGGLAIQASNTTYYMKVHLDQPKVFGGFTFNLNTGATGGHVGFGIYSADGSTKIADTGPVAAAPGNVGIQTATFAKTFVPAGDSIFAWNGDSTTIQITAISPNASPLAIENAAGTVLSGTAANASSAGQLPATLGALTGATDRLPVGVWRY